MNGKRGLTRGVGDPILNLMVNYQPSTLDRTFAALADPTRRALLARLDQEEGASVSELARPFPVSLPAIMKHLDVLSDAGLITRTKTGRTVSCQLTPAPMEQAMNWLAHYERYWTEQLDRLAAFLEEDQWQPNPASSSSAASKPRRKKSTKRGPSRSK
jgi:DNA-binding transcriptional ArsR family regulator